MLGRMDIGSTVDSNVLESLRQTIDQCREDCILCEELLRDCMLGRVTADDVRTKTDHLAKKWFRVWRDSFLQMNVSVPTEHKPCGRDIVWVCMLRCLLCAGLPVVDSRYTEVQANAFPALLQQECIVHEGSVAECSVHELMLTLDATVGAWCTNKYCDSEHNMFVQCLLRRVCELSCFVFSADVADDDRFTSLVETTGLVSKESHYACNTHFVRETNQVLHSLVVKNTARAQMTLSDRWNGLARAVPAVRATLHKYLETCYAKDIMAHTEKIVLASQVSIGERARHHFARPLVVADNDTIIRHFRPQAYEDITNTMDNIKLVPVNEEDADPITLLAQGVLAQQVTDYILKQNAFIHMACFVDYDVDDHASCFHRRENQTDPFIVKDCGCLRMLVGSVLSTQTNLEAVCLWVLFILRERGGKLLDGTDLRPAMGFLVEAAAGDTTAHVASINTTSFAMPS